jgi:hypothetical protein
MSDEVGLQIRARFAAGGLSPQLEKKQPSPLKGLFLTKANLVSAYKRREAFRQMFTGFSSLIATHSSLL